MAEQPLSEALSLCIDSVPVEPNSEYRIAGVYGFGRGLFQRGPIAGSETSYATLNRLHAGDLVMSRLKAFEGAIAVVDEEHDGWFLSPEFPTFRPRDGRLDPMYLGLLCRWPDFWDMLRSLSRGIGSRRERVHPDDLLGLEIDLPPIDVQRRVAKRLGAIAAQSEAVQRVSVGRLTRANAYVQSWLDSRLRAVRASAVLGDVADIHRGRGPRYEPGSGFIAVNQACVRWGGVDLRRAREVEQAWWEGTPPTAAVEMGDVLVNSTGEGTIGRAAVADAGCVGTPIDSHVMIVRSRSDGPLLPEFLEAYLRSAGGQAQVEAAKGANTTKQTELGKAKLERFLVPLPSLEEQRVFIASYLEMLDAVGALEAEFARSDAVLKAVLPSALNDAFADLS